MTRTYERRRLRHAERPENGKRRPVRGGAPSIDHDDELNTNPRPLALALGACVNDLERAAVRRRRDPREGYRLRARAAGVENFYLSAAHLAVAGGSVWAREFMQRMLDDLALDDIDREATALEREVMAAAP